MTEENIAVRQFKHRHKLGVLGQSSIAYLDQTNYKMSLKCAEYKMYGNYGIKSLLQTRNLITPKELSNCHAVKEQQVICYTRGNKTLYF